MDHQSGREHHCKNSTNDRCNIDRRPRLGVTLLLALVACANDKPVDTDPHVPPNGNGYTALVIDGHADCADCDLMLDTVASIGTSGGVELLSEFAAAWGTDEGSVVVGDSRSYPGQVMFRAHQQSTWVLMGRSGEGPGEFRFPTRVWFDSVGLHIYDAGLQRETVFRRDGSYEATLNHPAVLNQVVPLPFDRLAVSAIVRTADHAGYPIHVLDAERNIIRSFGAETALLLPGNELLSVRNISLSHDGGIWSAPPNEYRIEKWDSLGNRVASINRPADWFPTWHQVGRSSIVERPKPIIKGVWEDSLQRLWVVTHVADQNYAPIAARSESHQTPIRQATRDQFWDTLIEVLDPVLGRVIASKRFDAYLQTHPGPGLLSEFDEAEDGSARITITRMRLKG